MMQTPRQGGGAGEVHDSIIQNPVHLTPLIVDRHLEGKRGDFTLKQSEVQILHLCIARWYLPYWKVASFVLQGGAFSRSKTFQHMQANFKNGSPSCLRAESLKCCFASVIQIYNNFLVLGTVVERRYEVIQGWTGTMEAMPSTTA